MNRVLESTWYQIRHGTSMLACILLKALSNPRFVFMLTEIVDGP